MATKRNLFPRRQTLPVLSVTGAIQSPGPPGTSPGGRPGNLPILRNLRRPDIRDSIRIFPRGAAPSRSAALLPVAPKNPLPAAPPLRGLFMVPSLPGHRQRRVIVKLCTSSLDIPRNGEGYKKPPPPEARGGWEYSDMTRLKRRNRRKRLAALLAVEPGHLLAELEVLQLLRSELQ